jgi:hypothetical protein
MTTQETGHVTGTKDKDYNLLWFTQACLDNTLRLETYIADAERKGDSELAGLFRRHRPTAQGRRCRRVAAAVAPRQLTEGTRNAAGSLRRPDVAA